MAPAGTCSAVLGRDTLDDLSLVLEPGPYQSRGVGGVVCGRGVPSQRCVCGALGRDVSSLPWCRWLQSGKLSNFFYLLSLKPSRNPELLMTD